MIGITLIAFDRPQYMRRLLASLEQQTDLEGVTFHLFQDGPINAFSGRKAGSGEGIDAVRTMWYKADIPKGKMSWRIQNVGTGIHQFEALEWMMQRYRRMVLMEDDVVLSPHWVRLTKILYDQAEAWPDVYSFSLGFKRRCSRGHLAEHLDKLTFDYGHWWAECLEVEKWAKARAYFLPYYQMIKDVDYYARPQEEILALYERDGWPRPYTTQDGGWEYAVWRAGMRRAVAVANRGIGIGQEGEHFNPALFRELGMANQTPYIHAGDATLDRFEFVKEARCESQS